MKKRTKLLIALCSLSAAFTATAASCTITKQDDSSKTDSSVISQTPANYNFKLNKSTCRLSWDGEDGAMYEVSEDGTNWIKVESDRVNLLDVVTTTATTKIFVRWYVGDVKGEIAEFPITVQTLGVPKKATYYFNEETVERGFTWEKVEGANQYQVKVTSDGVTGNWVNASGTNVHIIGETGTHAISVRCKGFFDGDVLMIPGGASEVSDAISVYTAPTLKVPDTNRITWMADVEFDSYKLSITDGLGNKTIHENIELEGVDLNLVEEGYITKTGEYDIQVIGVKNGQSYGSNIWFDFGTLNINDNEIYSFDNRQMNMTLPQSGLTISNEQYVGKTDDPETNVAGYSMKIDGNDSTVTGQINLVKYGDYLDADMPVSDWRDITEISLQVYVPTQTDRNGNEVTSFSGDIVSVRFEEYLNSNDHAYATAGFSTYNFYGSTSQYPTDEWVTITIPCEVPYNIVLVMHHRFAELGIVGYIDEIKYTKAEDRSQSYNAKETAPAGTNYIATVGRRGALVGYQDETRTPINLGSQYAGKKVDLTFQVKGTATNPDNKPGFIILSEPRFNEEGQRGAPIDANQNGIEGEDYVLFYGGGGIPSQAHQMTEWQSYKVKNITIPETGIIWLDPFFRWDYGKNDATFADEVNIYIKDVDVYVHPSDISGMAYTENGTDPGASGNIQYSVGLKNDYFLTDGTTQYVNVTMKVKGTLASNYTGDVTFKNFMWGIGTWWTGETTTISGSLVDAFKSSEWVTVTIRMGHGYDGTGFLVPMTSVATEGFYVYVKDVVVDYESISMFEEYNDPNTAFVDVAVSGNVLTVNHGKNCEGLALKVDGVVVAENVTLTDGKIDITEYITETGLVTVEVVGTFGDEEVSKSVVINAKVEGMYYAYNNEDGAVTAEDQGIVLGMDQTRFDGSEQYVNVTMKVKGTLSADFNGYVVFYTYGWAITQGNWQEVGSITGPSLLKAFKSNEWVEITIRIKHLGDSYLVLFPMTSGSGSAFQVKAKDIVIDYDSISSSAESTIKQAYTANGTNPADATNNIAIGIVRNPEYDKMDWGSWYVNVTMKIKGTLAADYEGTATFHVYGCAINNGDLGEPTQVLSEGSFVDAFKSSEWVTVTIRLKKFMDWNFYLVPKTSVETEGFYVYAKDIVVDYESMSTFEEYNDPNTAFIDVTVSGNVLTVNHGKNCESLALKVDGVVVAENVTLTDGKIDVTEYITETGLVTVEVVGTFGDEEVSESVVIKAEVVGVYYAYNNEDGAVTAEDQGIVLGMDQTRFDGSEQYVNVTMKVKGTLSADFDGYVVFYTYGWAITQGNWQEVGSITGPSLLEAFKSNEWVEITIRIKHVGDSYLVLFPMTSGSGSAFQVKAKDIVIDYVTVSSDSSNPIKYAYNNEDGVVTAADQGIVVGMDQTRFDGSEQYVDVTMKVKGNLSADFNGYVVFYTYGWAITQGNWQEVGSITGPSLLNAFKSKEWVEITIRIKHSGDSYLVLFPMTSGSGSAFQVEATDIVIDYDSISASAESTIKQAYTANGTNPADATNNIAIGIVRNHENDKMDWSSQYVNVTMKIKGTLAADYEGTATFHVYGCGVNNCDLGEPTQVLEGTLVEAFKSSEWVTVTIRLKQLVDWNFYLVPKTSVETAGFYVYAKDIVVDYTTLSTEETWNPAA